MSNFLKTAVGSIAKHGKAFCKTAITVAKGHSPAILAGTAIVGAVAIAYTTYKCTPKYKQAVQEAGTTKETEHDEELDVDVTVEHFEEPTGKEKAKIFVKTMWPVVLATGVTITGIVLSHKMSAKKIAVLSAAYTAATQKASEAAEKTAAEFIKEKLGDDAAKEYKDKVDKEHAETDKVCASVSTNANRVYATDGGDELFMDYMTGVCFTASDGYVQAKIDTINSYIRSQGEECITYSDIMADIVPGFPDIGFAMREGFWVNGGNGDYPLSICIDVGMTADGKPCKVLRFHQMPGTLYE